MVSIEALAEEQAELRRCMRDLAALAAFPALWSTSGPQRIVEGVCEALGRMCRLDFVYVEVTTHEGARPVSWVRSADVFPALSPQALTGSLRAWVAAGASQDKLAEHADFPPDMRITVLPFGPEIASGTLVAGKFDPGFPAEADRLLLRVGVNQTAILLRSRRADEERERLFENEKRRAALLARVAQVSTALNTALSIDGIAKILTEEARSIIGSHQAVTSLTTSKDWAQAINAVSLSDKYASFRTYDAKPTGQGIYAEVCRTNTPMRLTQAQLTAHRSWRDFGSHKTQHPPMRGWLAVPLIGQGGKNLGLVQLSDKYEGDFDEQDEMILQQLAAIASVGIENARLYDSLREQDRRKDEFLAILAHELRNPLAPLRTGLEILRPAARQSAVTEKTHEIMSRQLAHMVRLIDDLMDVSRLNAGKVILKREHIPLQRAIEAALETSRPLIEAANHTLEITMPQGDGLRIDADETRLAQVFSNLLNNAAKYTPSGGRIKLSAAPEGEFAVVRIEDTGVGIPQDMLQKVFDLFMQVGPNSDRSGRGLGIGLSLAKKLVEMHSGDITVQSPGPGQGSTFTVRLPAVQDLSMAAGDATPASRPVAATSG